MLRCVDVVRTDVSEDLSASFIRVTRIGELRTTLAVPSNRRTLRRNTKYPLLFLRSVRRLLVRASVVPSSPILVTLTKEGLRSSVTSVLTKATRRNIPGDTILHRHRRKSLKSYVQDTIGQLGHLPLQSPKFGQSCSFPTEVWIFLTADYPKLPLPYSLTYRREESRGTRNAEIRNPRKLSRSHNTAQLSAVWWYFP
jgi:hypothetical protein